MYVKSNNVFIATHNNLNVRFILKPSLFFFRAKLLQNMKTLLNERTDEEMTVVYDLDKLMMEEKLRENMDNGNCVNGKGSITLGSDVPRFKRRMLKAPPDNPWALAFSVS